MRRCGWVLRRPLVGASAGILIRQPGLGLGGRSEVDEWPHGPTRLPAGLPAQLESALKLDDAADHRRDRESGQQEWRGAIAHSAARYARFPRARG